MTARTKTKPKPRKAAARPKKAGKALIVRNTTLANPDDWLLEWVGGAPSSSGERVNETTALGLAAYFACIRNISEDEAKLPLGMYEELLPRGRNALRRHYLAYMLQGETNSEMSSFSFRQTLMVHALGWGNGYAEIVRDTSGTPIALWPLDPTGVEVQRDTFGEKLLFYRVHGVPMTPRNIFHLHREGFTGVAGWALTQLQKDPLGNALAAQKFAGSFFGNGTTTTGTIEVPGAMSETAFKHLRESFMQRHTGSENQHRPVILEQGAKFNPTSTEPQKSQMVETMQFGIEEVCRMFRMPPHKVQHLLRATFSNIEEQNIEYVNDCLMGWLVRLEQEIDRKLLFPKERTTTYAKHNVDMLMRGDVAKRSAFYQIMFNIGAYSINDIREKEDLNPVDGGDTHFVNGALIPLEMAATGEHMKPKTPPAMPDSSGTDQNGTGAESNADYRLQMAGRMAAANVSAIEDEVRILLRVEQDNVRNAAKVPNGDRRIADFYQKSHRKEVAKRLRPAIRALSASLEAILEGAGHG